MSFADTLRRWFRRQKQTDQPAMGPPFLGLLTSDVERRWGVKTTAGFKSYEGLGWVYACVHKIASSLSSLPLLVKRTRRGEEPELAENAALTALLDITNSVYGFASLKYETVSDLLLDGDCYWYKNLTNRRAAPIAELWRLQPDLMRVVPGKDRWIDGYLMTKAGRERRFEEEEIIHFFVPNPRQQFNGLAPLTAAALAAETDKAAGEANFDFAKKGFMPDWWVKIPGYHQQDEESARAMQRKIEQGMQGKRHHVHLLTEGTEVIDAQKSLRDMEFQALKRMNREEICGVYGVPPPVVGILEQATYSNFDIAQRAFWGDTVRFWANLVEERLTEDLLPHYGNDLIAAFDFSAVECLQDSDLDDKDRALREVELGVLTPNQYLTLFYPGLDLLPPDIGDQVYMPFNRMPVGAGAATEAALEEAAKRVVRSLLVPLIEKRQEAPKQLGPAEYQWPSGERGTAIWKKFDRETSALANAMQGRVEELIDKQVSGVKHRLELRGEKRVRDAEEWIGYIIFDETGETVLWQQALTPFQTEALRMGAMQVLAEIDIPLEGGFNIAAPEVADYLTRREVGIQTIVGNRAGELRQSLLEGYRAGETVPQLSQRVDQYGTDAEWKSDRIAWTETHSCANAGRHEGMRQSGIEYKEWLCARLPTSREAHIALDGTIIPIDEDFVSGAGGTGPHPGEMGNAADDCNCHCTEAPSLRAS